MQSQPTMDVAIEQEDSGRLSNLSYYEAAMAGFATTLVVAAAIGLNSFT